MFVAIIQLKFIVTDIQTAAFNSTHTYDRISVTYFQFQIPLLVCFYTVIEVK